MKAISTCRERVRTTEGEAPPPPKRESSIFVQIGDENVHLVRSLLDEVFGSENFVSLIAFKKTSAVGSFAGGTTVIASTCDYISGTPVIANA